MRQIEKCIDRDVWDQDDPHHATELSTFETDPLVKNIAAMYANHGSTATRKVISDTLAALARAERLETIAHRYIDSAHMIRERLA
jgi:hypothetical protein